MSWERELEFAARIAAEAGGHAMALRKGITADEKPDHSPVTRADKECERMMARAIVETYPEDGVLGEEGARSESRSGRRWIIDPIDGTRDYLRGNPLWGPMIALEEKGEVVAGHVRFPALGTSYWASRGGGAYGDGERLRVSSKTAAEESVLCINQFNKLDPARYSGRILEWLSRFWAVRGLGGTPDAMMVASGQAEMWVEPGASPWYCAVPKIVVEEAGGLFRNFDGGSSIYAGNGIALAPGLTGELAFFRQ
jgi:histidinol-phosphatase